MQFTAFLLCVLGLGVGGAVAWLFAKGRAAGDSAALRERIAAREAELEKATALAVSRETDCRNLTAGQSELREQMATLKAQMEAAQGNAQEKLDQLLAIETNLREGFAALSAKALRDNNSSFIVLAREVLGQQQQDAAGELDKKQTAIESMLKPVQETLGQLTTQTQEMERRREGAYKEVLTEIKNVQQSHTDLRRETNQLVQALRAPKVRGNWGELQLKKCVEFAGMVQHASFEVEQFVRGEEQSIRPDLVVKLPNGRTIIVDAKTPLDAFLDASDTQDENLRREKMTAHAARVRHHLDNLSKKAYWRQFLDSPDFVVCFLPSEVLFSAALEHDPGLIEHSASSNVLLATPTTLIALLKAVHFGWEQAAITKNALAIRDTATSIYAKLAGMHESLVNLGARLKAAGKCYDDMVTKVEGRGGIFPLTRKLKELSIGGEDLNGVDPLSLSLRPMQSEDWQQDMLTLPADTKTQ